MGRTATQFIASFPRKATPRHSARCPGRKASAGSLDPVPRYPFTICPVVLSSSCSPTDSARVRSSDGNAKRDVSANSPCQTTCAGALRASRQTAGAEKVHRAAAGNVSHQRREGAPQGVQMSGEPQETAFQPMLPRFVRPYNLTFDSDQILSYRMRGAGRSRWHG